MNGFLKKYSFVATLFLIGFELILITVYFVTLVPHYESIEYTKPHIDLTKNLTCNIFITQIEAQEYYNSNIKSIPRLAELDNDRDGKVCENLP